MTDWGVHMLDYALLGMKASEPISIMATGGKFADPNGASETPDTMSVVYAFDNFSVEWEHTLGIGLGPYGKTHGVAFIGENGTLVLNRGGWEVIPEKEKMKAVSHQKPKDKGLDLHMENFVGAILKNDRSVLNAPIQVGRDIAVFSQMGNIAYRTGEKLYWDRSKKKFTNKKANSYLFAKYHNGYKLPTV
jgi:predicted dehydrogenase